MRMNTIEPVVKSSRHLSTVVVQVEWGKGLRGTADDTRDLSGVYDTNQDKETTQI
jgi:hypothetical protein